MYGHSFSKIRKPLNLLLSPFFRNQSRYRMGNAGVYIFLTVVSLNSPFEFLKKNSLKIARVTACTNLQLPIQKSLQSCVKRSQTKSQTITQTRGLSSVEVSTQVFGEKQKSNEYFPWPAAQSEPNPDWFLSQIGRFITTHFSQQNLNEKVEISKKIQVALQVKSRLIKTWQLFAWIESLPLVREQKNQILENLIRYPSRFRFLQNDNPTATLEFLVTKYSVDLAMKVLFQQTQHLFQMPLDQLEDLTRFLDSLRNRKLAEAILIHSLSHHQLLGNANVQAMIMAFQDVAIRLLPRVQEPLLLKLMGLGEDKNSATMYTNEFLSLTVDDIRNMEKQLQLQLAKENIQTHKVIENYVLTNPRVLFSKRFSFESMLQVLLYIYKNRQDKYGQHLESLTLNDIHDILQRKVIHRKNLNSQLQGAVEGFIQELIEYMYPPPSVVTALEKADVRTYMSRLIPNHFWAFVHYLHTKYYTYLMQLEKARNPFSNVSLVASKLELQTKDLTRKFVIKHRRGFESRIDVWRVQENMEYLEKLLGEQTAFKIFLDHFSMLNRVDVLSIKSKRLEVVQVEGLTSTQVNQKMQDDFSVFMRTGSQSSNQKPASKEGVTADSALSYQALSHGPKIHSCSQIYK